MHSRLILLTAVLFFITTFSTSAQKIVDHQQLVWFTYLHAFHLHERWTLVNDIQERRFRKPDAQHTFLIRSNLQHDLGEGWNVGAGFCVYLQSPNNPDADIRLVVPELRPHLEFNLRQKYKFFQLDHRWRGEARFYHHTNTTVTELEDGYAFGNFRLRYQLMSTIPVWKWSTNRALSLRLGSEILLNAGQKIVNNFFDQVRLSAGFRADIIPDVAVEVGYMNWFQQQKTGNHYYNRDILRFGIIHKINSKQSQ